MNLTTYDTKLKRRDNLIIIAEIMNIAKNGTSKTNIMLKAKLSFTQLNEYLQQLSKLRLLEKHVCDKREIYKSTRKGLEFMEKQYQILDWLYETNHT